VATGDVNGDRLADLVMIAHDRILIYRQDNGTSPPSPVKPVRSANAAAATSVKPTSKPSGG
jgi:hypothetical protein